MPFEISKRILITLLLFFIVTTVTLVVVIVILTSIRPSKVLGCTVSVNKGLGNPQTLILKPGIEHGLEEFHWPSYGDNIRFKENEEAILACPGGKLLIAGVSTKEESAEVKCSSNSFNILGETVAFNAISCSKIPVNTARYTGNSCLTDSKEVEIGFKLKDGRFIRHISVCFDDVLQSTRYTTFNLTKSIGGLQSGFPRPDFIEGDFYKLPTPVNNLYQRKNQRKVINDLLGLPPNSTKYIQNSNDFFLARGHMTAKADFVYGAQHRLTFYYINVAPQWQTFNGGNWNTLEGDVRSYSANKQKDLVVYTGVHGVSTLPHAETGEDVELYLYADGENKAIPVPEIYWKVIYEPNTEKGVAFVGINNPYEKNVQKSIFCKNMCQEIKWLQWKAQDVKVGYSYCCDVNELRETVKNIPKFEVTSMLV